MLFMNIFGHYELRSLLVWLVVVTVISVPITSISMDIPGAASRIRDEPESVWAEFTKLALKYKPLNLGQGFPDFAAPKYLLESLHNATAISLDPNIALNNQYTRSFGHPRLINVLQKYYNRYRGFNKLLNSNEQILITVGAYEAIFASIMAFVDPHDEVIIIDPAFDAYAPIVDLAQGKKVYIRLRTNMSEVEKQLKSRLSSSDFALDMEELASKISPKTKMLVLNTPNNPLGKIFSRQELERIADLCIRNNILVLADEVYEQMYLSEEDKHLSIASLPGMWNRTITVGSAGKTFSVTGWKIGWAFGPPELIKYVQLIHQTSIYVVATPLQEAVARAFEHEIDLLDQEGEFGFPGSTEANYWRELRSDLVRKRNRMADILEGSKMRPIVPQGGYFMLAEFSALSQRFPDYKTSGKFDMEGRPNTNDFKFARWLSADQKLQVIPASAFYSPENKKSAENLVRFCFIKKDATLDELEAKLRNLTLPTAGKAEDLRSKL